MLNPAAMYSQDKSPLCFTSKNGNVTVRFDIKNVTHTILYSTDSTNWKKYISGMNVNIYADQSVYFRAKKNQAIATAFAYFDSENDKIIYSHFDISSTNGGTVECSGNIMSLYGPDCPDLPLQEFAFANMFYGCTALITAPSLPASTLARNCYEKMFMHCTSLTATPYLFDILSAQDYNGMCYSLRTKRLILPAKTLARYCYSRMFCGCTSLTAAPILPATILAEGCYFGMFSDCTSLNKIPSLPANNLTERCYSYMFSGCTSLILNTFQPGKAWTIPTKRNLFFGLEDMFKGTGGSMHGTPEVNTIYYIASDPDMKK